jgi:hypothetical protein
MKLKLLAPIRTEGFDLRGARVLRDPNAYTDAWTAAADDLPGVRDTVFAAAAPRVEAVRFMHARTYITSGGSRYRTISTHSLPRPEHAIEIEFRTEADTANTILGDVCAAIEREALESESPRVRDAIEDIKTTMAGFEPLVLVRVFDHGVALIEFDLPVPGAVRAAADAGDTNVLAAKLDTLQQEGVRFAEQLGNDVHARVLAPLFAWIRDHDKLGGRFVRADAPPAGAYEGGDPRDDAPGERRAATPADTRAMWVTRSLVFQDSDGLELFDATAQGDSQPGRARRAILAHWLRDVADDGESINKCATDRAAFSVRWLNYLFCEDRVGDPIPARGWHHSQRDGRAEPFGQIWEAMLSAQYFYAAFDVLQSSISRILTLAIAGEGRRKITDVKLTLDGVIRDANVLTLEYVENRKLYAQTVHVYVEQILKGWDFEDALLAQVEKRIKDCENRLNELHNRSLEQSAIYTDIILLAIGITVIFEVLLYLAEYGRTMKADPTLAGYDRGTMNLIQQVATSSTDAVLVTGLVFSAGLIALYIAFRIHRSRV